MPATVTVTKTGNPNEQTLTVKTEEVPVVAKLGVEEPVPVNQTPQIEMSTLLLLGGICAVISWGVTQVVKSFIQDLTKVRGSKKPWWYLSLVRLLCIAVGGLAGYYLKSSFGHCTTHFAVAVGCSAGVLSTFIVGLIKTKLKKAAGA